MNSVNNKKDFTFRELESELISIQTSGKKDIKKISDIFCRVYNIKEITKEEVEKLFFKAINVSDNNSWKLLLEIYSRSYNRAKSKKQKGIIQLVEIEIKNRISSFISVNEINTVITSVLDDGRCDLFIGYLDKIDEFCEEKELPQQEMVAYLYIIILIIVRKLYPNESGAEIKVERLFFAKFAKNDKNDPLFVKNIKKSFFDDRFDIKFKEMIYLYDGVEDEVSKLKADNNRKTEIIFTKTEEISKLKEESFNLNNEILKINQVKKERETEIDNLRLLVAKTNDRNEYNENLYKQQFNSLKRSLVEKLKKDIQLEIEGLEDIADTLSDMQREKIQRRIDRIYKILQKIGE